MLDSLREALNFDSSLYTHPVSVEVQNPAQINEIVDKITYHKVRFLTFKWNRTRLTDAFCGLTF